MERSEEILNDCVELFFTVRKEFKLRCGGCEGTLYFDSMNDFIEHWINKHKEALSWFSQPAVSSTALLENEYCYANKPTLRIKPSTRSFEINCNTCGEENIFDSVENYIAHFLETHQNLEMQPDKDSPDMKCKTSNNQFDSSDSDSLVESDGNREEELEETTMTNLENYFNFEPCQQDVEMLETISLNLVVPYLESDNEPNIQNTCLLNTPSISLIDLDNLEQTVQSIEDFLNVHALEDTKLPGQLSSLINNDLVIPDNVTHETKKHLQIETAGSTSHCNKTLSSGTDVMQSNINQSPEAPKTMEFIPPTKDMTNFPDRVVCEASTALHNEIQYSTKHEESESDSEMINNSIENSIAQNLVEKENLGILCRERLIYISEIANLSQRILTGSTQIVGLFVEMGTIESYSIGDQSLEEVVIEDLETKVSNNLPNTLTSNPETSVKPNVNQQTSVDIQEETNVMQLTKSEETNCNEELQQKSIPESIQNECSLLVSDPNAENELSSNTNTSTAIPIKQNQSAKLETSNFSQTTVIKTEPNDTNEEEALSQMNSSINENPKASTRKLTRKRKAPNADQENTTQKKIAKKAANTLYCTICKKTFQRVYNYNVHMKRFHPLTKCSLCKKDFQEEEKLLQHLKTYKNRVECPICHETDSWYSKLHLKKHFNLLDCSSCELLTCDKNTLRRHQQTCGLLVCKVCNIPYENANSFRRHALSLHKNREPFECDQCEQKFQYLRAMEAHQKTCHPMNEAQKRAKVN